MAKQFKIQSVVENHKKFHKFLMENKTRNFILPFI